MITVYPNITDDILENPGIGFIAAPALMGRQEVIRDNRGNVVEGYQFKKDAKTYNHPDSGIYYCGAMWKDLEPRQGLYDWSILDQKLEYSAGLGCTSVVRVAPYALSEEEDIPPWLRVEYPVEPEFPFWRIDPNTTCYPECWAAFVAAFAKRYDGNPNISSVDMAIVGAWGEGGGTEFMEEEAIILIAAAYIEGFKRTPLQALLHDPKSLECIRGFGRKVGFRVDCLGDMGGFHGAEWSHMLDFYPQNIVNFHMQDAWRDAPVVFEACWHMNDWFQQGWDIEYIIRESLKWHISSYNGKGSTVPLEWKSAVEHWIKKMGYRFEIHRIRYPVQVKQGESMELELLLVNRGVAPSYHNYPPVLRLERRDLALTAERVADIPLPLDIRSWMPGEDRLERVLLPINVPICPGTYEMKLGFPTGLRERPTLAIAIAGRDENGFYPIGKIRIEEGGRWEQE